MQVTAFIESGNRLMKSFDNFLAKNKASIFKYVGQMVSGRPLLSKKLDACASKEISSKGEYTSSMVNKLNREANQISSHILSKLRKIPTCLLSNLSTNTPITIFCLSLMIFI
jgi:hypothetical protein